MLELALIQQCAPQMTPLSVNALVKTESSFNPWAIGVNSARRLSRQPSSYQEASNIATTLMSRQASFDLGLAQINSKNLGFLNLTVEQVLDPCTNLQAMQTIFTDCLDRAKVREPDINKAFAMAFSCYNTGNFSSGFNNGYVNKILNNHHFFINQYTPSIAFDEQYGRYSLPTNSEDLAAYAQYYNQQNRKQNVASNQGDVDLQYKAQAKVQTNALDQQDSTVEQNNLSAPQGSSVTVGSNVSADEQVSTSITANDTVQPEVNTTSSTLPISTVKVHHTWDVFQDF